MNWLLILVVWGNYSHTVTHAEFQTKFLCEKAATEMNHINQVPAKEIPLGGFFRCVQDRKVEKQVPQQEKRKAHVKNPKFKIGDCVSQYGFDPFKIYEVWQDERLEEDMYAVVLDASCKEKDRVLCNSSSVAYGIETVDKNGKLVDCP